MVVRIKRWKIKEEFWRRKEKDLWMIGDMDTNAKKKKKFEIFGDKGTNTMKKKLWRMFSKKWREDFGMIGDISIHKRRKRKYFEEKSGGSRISIKRGRDFGNRNKLNSTIVQLVQFYMASRIEGGALRSTRLFPVYIVSPPSSSSSCFSIFPNFSSITLFYSASCFTISLSSSSSFLNYSTS